jgi:LacI family transcriptional regulator
VAVTRDGVTIRDVAAHAGVSIATVSRVLRGTTPVTPATRDRVLAAVSELEFRPNALGRFLAEGRHAANGIVFPDLSGPYFAEVVLGYEEMAGELGRSVLILSTHGRDAAPDLVRELAGRVDGLVVLGRTVSDEVVKEIADRGLPVVVLARPAPSDVDSIKAENRESAQRLTEHLIGHGCRRFVFLGDVERSPDSLERWAGFRTALEQAGVTPPAGPVGVGLREDEGLRAADELLGGDAETTRHEVLPTELVIRDSCGPHESAGPDRR